MPRLSLTEAGRRIGVSRQTIYSYIRKGRLSASRESDGKPYIDLAELQRVFPDKLIAPEPLQPEQELNDSNGYWYSDTEHQALEARFRELEPQAVKVPLLEQQIALLKAQLDHSQQNERYLQQQLAEVIRQPKGLLEWLKGR